MATKKIENKELMFCRGRNVDFLMCNIQRPTSDFSDSWSPYNVTEFRKINKKTKKQEIIKKLPYCKDCNNKIYKKYRDDGMGVEEALFYVCQLNNVPYIGEKVKTTLDFISSEAKRGAIVKNIFGVYYSNLLKEKSKHNLWLDFSYTDVDYNDIMSNIEIRDVQKKDFEQLELDWGKQENTEDYSLLDYWFNELVGDKEMDAPEELSYRDLCLARLAKRKAEQYNPEGDNSANIQQIQKQINDLMKLLKIDNFEEKKRETIVERMLEKRIEIVEKEQPAFYYKDLKKNEDFLGRGKYFHDYVFRPFKNVFKHAKEYNTISKENDSKTNEEYEEEMLSGK